MLEPAVRPGLPAQGGAERGKPAFEDRTFQDLLKEAGQVSEEGAGAQGAGAQASEKADPLAALGGLGQIENAALRSVLAQLGRPVDGKDQTG